MATPLEQWQQKYGQRASTPQEAQQQFQTTPFSLTPSKALAVTPQVSDLAGYQKMRGQVSQGADFSGNLSRLQDLVSNPSSFQTDPSYQWRVQQGQQARERNAAAQHMGNSGNLLAELTKYGQDMASQEYGNQFSRLADLVGQQQRFGLASGYFAEPARTTTRMEGGQLIDRTNLTPTYW